MFGTVACQLYMYVAHSSKVFVSYSECLYTSYSFQVMHDGKERKEEKEEKQNKYFIDYFLDFEKG